MTSSTAIVAVMILVVLTAALLTAREDMPRPEAAREEIATTPVAIETNLTPRDAKPIETTKPAVAVTRTANAQSPQPTAVATSQLIEPDPQPEREKTGSVTISGCLENDEGTFLLSDTSGAAAPMSRSWKSGFLRKRSARIELADGVGTLNLRTHVGRRVTATGTLVDREMRVDSVRATGACE
jgi:hypothetical protein